jgi:hypothetical protein
LANQKFHELGRFGRVLVEIRQLLYRVLHLYRITTFDGDRALHAIEMEWDCVIGAVALEWGLLWKRIQNGAISILEGSETLCERRKRRVRRVECTKNH